MKKFLKNLFTYEVWEVWETTSTIEQLIRGDWRGLTQISPKSRQFSYADPYYYDNTVYCEKFNYRTLGHIVTLEQDDTGKFQETVFFKNNYHVSFFTILNDQEFCLEQSSLKSVAVYSLTDNSILRQMNNVSEYLDPVFFSIDENLFLFVSTHEKTRNDALYLYHFNNEKSKWQRVSKKPICLSQDGGRMAGQLLKTKDQRLIRFGQISHPEYGSGVSVFNVNLISTSQYVEEKISEIKPPPISGVCGIHTINKSKNGFVIDCKYKKYPSFRRIRQSIIKKISNVI